MTDRWPEMVREVVHGLAGADLLTEFERHVAHMTRPYPDAYFTLGQKSEEGVRDLTDRSFTACARITKGRHPFAGREPFRACVEERFDGRAIRYHSIYARLSITREILRDDYAKNIVRDPVLRWRADLYSRIGRVLKEHAVPSEGRPRRWALANSGPVRMLPPEVIETRLRESGERDVEALTLAALRSMGSATQSNLARLLGDVLGGPADARTMAVYDDAIMGSHDRQVDERLAVRQAVLAAWSDLDEDGRALLHALARGDSYDEVIAAHPRLRNRVAVSRAIARVTGGFVKRIQQDLGITEAAGRPREVAECIAAVLAEIRGGPHGT